MTKAEFETKFDEIYSKNALISVENISNILKKETENNKSIPQDKLLAILFSEILKTNKITLKQILSNVLPFDE
jgi:hypothetical protein